MRELTVSEMSIVSGACSEDGGDGGVIGFSREGSDLSAVYEGLVEATSYLIEWVADAL